MKRHWIGLIVLPAVLYTTHPCTAQDEVTQVENVSVETAQDAVRIFIQTNHPPVYRAFKLTDGTVPMKVGER